VAAEGTTEIEKSDAIMQDEN